MKTVEAVLLILISISVFFVSCDLVNEIATFLTSKQTFAFIDPLIEADFTGVAMFIQDDDDTITLEMGIEDLPPGFTRCISTKTAIAVRPTVYRLAVTGIRRIPHTANGAKVSSILVTSAI